MSQITVNRNRVRDKKVHYKNSVFFELPLLPFGY